MSITLTDSCVKQLKALREQENSPDLMLRIQVNGGGCQGFEYAFKSETQKNTDDIVIEKDGTSVIIDEASVPFLENAEVDYVDDMISARFQINNPNATSSCGCGGSFSV